MRGVSVNDVSRLNLNELDQLYFHGLILTTTYISIG